MRLYSHDLTVPPVLTSTRKMSNSMKRIDRDDEPVNYGEPTYWERRYELDRKEYGTSYRHDWYCEIDQLKATLESHFERPKGQRILIVGCGYSNVASEMHAMGYRCITALDISATVIALMQTENQEKEGLEYTVGDVRKMDSQPDELYDCIFDKGCADSLICGIRATDDVLDMFRECCRVLRPQGVFLCISHGEPDARMHILTEGLQWNTSAIPMHESEGLFIYICTKWSREEVEEKEKTRLRDLETMISMPSQNSTGRFLPGGRQRIMQENLIIYTKAPPGVDGGDSCAKSSARKTVDGIAGIETRNIPASTLETRNI